MTDATCGKLPGWMPVAALIECCRPTVGANALKNRTMPHLATSTFRRHVVRNRFETLKFFPPSPNSAMCCWVPSLLRMSRGGHCKIPKARDSARATSPIRPADWRSPRVLTKSTRPRSPGPPRHRIGLLGASPREAFALDIGPGNTNASEENPPIKLSWRGIV
jgi:hypothetical protein